MKISLNLNILFALCAVLLSLAGIVSPVKAAFVTDGVISAGEWDSSMIIAQGCKNPSNPETPAIDIYGYADTSRLYLAYDVVSDTTDARAGSGIWDYLYLGVGVVGDTDCLYRVGLKARSENNDPGNVFMDGYWMWWVEMPDDDTHLPVPEAVEASTSFASAHRVTEWSIPMNLIGASQGQSLMIGGGLHSPDGAHIGRMYRYPIGMDWYDQNSWVHLSVLPEAIPEPATIFMLGLGGLALLKKRRP